VEKLQFIWMKLASERKKALCSVRILNLKTRSSINTV
jgi:hypothetical protein